MIIILQIIMACIGTFLFFALLGLFTIEKFKIKCSKLFCLPLGFITYQAIFWFLSVWMIYLHLPWYILQWTATGVFVIIIFYIIKMIKIKYSSNEMKKKIDTWSKIIMVALILFGLAHGLLQVGFWSSDNAMSDNSFYVSIATTVVDSPAMFSLNSADGMLGSQLMESYYMATYEVSIAFLSQIFLMSPASYMRIIMPITMSVNTLFVIYCLFKLFLKKSTTAFIGVVMFLVYMHTSPNYRNAINDYDLGEWFLLFYHVGKAYVRYLVIPSLIYLFAIIYQKIKTMEITTSADFQGIIVLLNVVGLAMVALSPGASLYYLSLIFVFCLILLLFTTLPFIRLLYFGLCTGFMGFFTLAISFITQYLSVGVSLTLTNDTPETANIFLRLLGIKSDFFNIELLKGFFVRGELFSTEYWYLRWMHIFIMLLALISTLIWLYYRIWIKLSEKRRNPFFRSKTVSDKLMQKIQYYQSSNIHDIIVFGCIFPILYILFTHLPPIVEVIGASLDIFVVQRIIGAYPYEIFVIIIIIFSVQIILDMDKIMRKYYKSKQLKGIFANLAILKIIVPIIAFSLIIFIPTRPLVYEQAADQERVSRLKFKDDYYSGKFDYKLLLANPERLDSQAYQLVQVLSEKSGDKIIAGTINQFFGISHVRNYDPSIKVVKTRFSVYDDKEKSDASWLLKIYFSPWEESFKRYQDNNSTEDVKKALKLFAVEYLIVIKSHKEKTTFGNDIGSEFSDIISETEETELFYIYTINQ